MIEQVTEETIQRALRQGFTLRMVHNEIYDACVLEAPRGDESRGWCCEWRTCEAAHGHLIFYPSWLTMRLKELENDGRESEVPEV